jgi:transmembrane sensor
MGRVYTIYDHPRMTHSTPDWNRIGRYVAGEASPEEAAEVRRWLAEHPADAAVIAELQSIARSVGQGVGLDVEGALRAVKARRAGDRRRTWRIAGVAAAAVLLVSVGIFSSRRFGSGEDVHSTSMGVRDTVTLADGSTMILGPSSRAVVRDREIELSGEAFLDIVHDSTRPYVVRAGGSVIRDIGTRFGVRNYPDEPLRVLVAHGAVEVQRASSRVMLDENDVGIVDPNGTIAFSRDALTPDDVAWTQGRLVFRNTPLPRVAADLKRWYGVELVVTDSALLRRHFTGAFTGESTSRVLDVIALALGARVERRGDSAYVRIDRPER